MNRGEIYLLQGQTDKAKKELQKAIKLGCDDNKVFKLLDRCI